MLRNLNCAGSLFAVLFSVHSHAVDERIASLGVELESAFRAQTGLGFRSFDCDITPDGSVPFELECYAEDDEGDNFVYRLWFSQTGEAGAVSMWQPVQQLESNGLAWLLEPIDRFLTAFDEADWAALRDSYLPELANALPPDNVSVLSELRQMIGPVRGYRHLLYSNNAPGVHTLEVAIDGEQGQLVGRFRVQENGAGEARLSAYMISPLPGSKPFESMLIHVARQTLEPLLGRSISTIDLPLSELRRTGNAVEGELQLADETRIAVRAQQKSPAHDFDNSDYTFQVLEAEWIIADYLVKIGKADAQVSCPSRTVSDGGALVCRANLSDGTVTDYEIRRRGGEHRLGLPAPKQ